MLLFHVNLLQCLPEGQGCVLVITDGNQAGSTGMARLDTSSSVGASSVSCSTLRSWVILTSRRCFLCSAAGNQLCSATGTLSDIGGFMQTPPTASHWDATWAGDMVPSFLWMHSGENSLTFWQAWSLPGLCCCEQWAAPLSKAWAVQVQHPLGSERSCCSEGGCSCLHESTCGFQLQSAQNLLLQFFYLLPPAVAFQGAESVAFRTVNCSESSTL